MTYDSVFIWDRLKNEARPVVMYGMGDGAVKILNACKRFGIKISDIFASDEYVRGHSFEGFKVLKYADILKKYEDCIILLAFAAFQTDLLEKIYGIAKRYEVLAPYVPLFGDGLFVPQFFNDHIAEIEKAYSLLYDAQSKAVYQGVVNYMISGKISCLKQIETPRKEVFSEILSFCDREIYVDLGAYDGDTVEEFVDLTDNCYEKIIAFEPDVKNYKKLLARIEQLKLKKVKALPFAAWSQKETLAFSGRGGRNSALSPGGYEVPAESVDNVLEGGPATYIKLDVEGAEYEALSGCKETIKKYAPKLGVSAYHKTEDFFAIPLLVHCLNENYKIFMRHHPYIPAWETNVYAAL